MPTVTLRFDTDTSAGEFSLMGSWVNHDTAIDEYVNNDGGHEDEIVSVTCDDPYCADCAD